MKSGHRWYAIRTYAGQEKAAKKAIVSFIAEEHLEEILLDVIIPTEDVIEIKNGEKRITERSLYSGYVFANILLDSQNVLLGRIQSLSKVSGFVGGPLQPTPLSEEDIKKILDKVKNRAAPRPKFKFDKNDEVRINEGSFMNFTGTVAEYDIDSGKLKLNVPIFGRIVPVDILHSQVEKIEK
jgi:transcriptional antiterminator NusG